MKGINTTGLFEGSCHATLVLIDQKVKPFKLLANYTMVFGTGYDIISVHKQIGGSFSKLLLFMVNKC
jgi:hypothetical protein